MELGDQTITCYYVIGNHVIVSNEWWIMKVSHMYIERVTGKETAIQFPQLKQNLIHTEFLRHLLRETWHKIQVSWCVVWVGDPRNNRFC